MKLENQHYFVFNNGTLIQYGFLTIQGVAGTFTASLNRAFKNINYWIIGNAHADTAEDGSAKTRYGACFPKTVSTFTIGTASVKGFHIRYLAIGS